jgi:hypothetical protein
MALYRFLFAPALLVAAVWLGRAQPRLDRPRPPAPAHAERAAAPLVPALRLVGSRPDPGHVAGR